MSRAVSSIFPAMRFSWEIKSVDAVFCNGGSYGIPRINDLSKEAMLQAITNQDLRFLAVIQLRQMSRRYNVDYKLYCRISIHLRKQSKTFWS